MPYGWSLMQEPHLSTPEAMIAEIKSIGSIKSQKLDKRDITASLPPPSPPQLFHQTALNFNTFKSHV